MQKNFGAVLACAFSLYATNAFSQGSDPGLVDIEVGSSRIGGPGLSDERRGGGDLEEDEYITEENLPPPGHKKRIPSLHVLASRAVSGNAWIEACDRYDQIAQEGGDEAIAAVEASKRYASRSYLECAKSKAAKGEADAAEALLKKSERIGGSDNRHGAVRRRMSRDAYRNFMAAGHYDRAMTEFKKYYADSKDEDERIWMGDQFAKLAWNAHRAKDEVTTKQMIGYAESIAPQNTELRKLKDQMRVHQTVVGNVLLLAVGALLVIGVVTVTYRWRARKKLRDLTGEMFLGGKESQLLDE